MNTPSLIQKVWNFCPTLRDEKFGCEKSPKRRFIPAGVGNGALFLCP